VAYRDNEVIARDYLFSDDARLASDTAAVRIASAQAFATLAVAAAIERLADVIEATRR
jgi:hypothetical protein